MSSFWAGFPGSNLAIWAFRTATEIQRNRWAGSVTGSDPNLIAYWDFEPGADLKVIYDRTAHQLNARDELNRALTWTVENAPSSGTASLFKNIENQLASIADAIAQITERIKEMIGR